jgi:two-component system, NtrC family, response regulator HydG
MPPACQVKMLRVIAGQGFRPVGGKREIHTDVRVIAASRKDLRREVDAGRFREDLYFRLRVVCISVPPLREHVQDLPEIIDHFLKAFAADSGRRKRLSPEALQLLTDYSWPGNVRELRTTLECAVVMSEGDVLGPHDFPALHCTPAPTDLPQSLNLEHVEAWAILQALRKTGWNITRAAKILDISRETLSTKIRKYGLRREDGKGPVEPEV